MDKQFKYELRNRITGMCAHLFRIGAPLWDDDQSPSYEYVDLGAGKFEVNVDGVKFTVTVS